MFLFWQSLTAGGNEMSSEAVVPQPRTPFEEKYLAEAKRICLEMVPDLRCEIFLFGSRARGHCEHSSDVDIGICGPAALAGGVSRLVDRLIESDVP